MHTVTEGKKTWSKGAVVSSVVMMGFCWRVSFMEPSMLPYLHVLLNKAKCNKVTSNQASKHKLRDLR